MPIGIYDLDDEDDIVQSVQEEEPPVQQETTQDDDYVLDYLKTRGIDDPTKINFEEDDGQIVQRSWNDLSNEEKINILKTPVEQQPSQQEIEDNNELSEDEINLINSIRQSNMTPQQFISQFQTTEVQPQYKIDELSDDEIFLLDLESRVGELTDEEAAEMLNNAKQNETLYNKQVEGIRKEYKEREDLKSQQEQAEYEQQQQQAFEEYQAYVVDAINNFNSIGEFDLNFSDDDKEELAEFMLSQDETGANYLSKALSDPQILTRAAWFILNGEDAFNNISDYFKKQIKLVGDNQYKKGLEDAKKGVQTSIVIDNSKNKTKTHQVYNSINDLDDDE